MQPLSILEWKRDHVTIDFVVGVSKIESGKDAIWIIIDRLTKFAYFIPVKISSSFDRLARLYVNEIICRYGVPVVTPPKIFF